MREGVRRAGLAVALAGFDPRATLRAARNLPRFIGDRRRFARLSEAAGTPPPLRRHLLPALGDVSDAAGTTGEYFLADLWVARRVHARRPDRHVDVGSRVDGLVAHLLTFMPVEVVDLRPLESDVEGLRFVHADATDLTGIDAPSVSSVHALEHFGLGRYGDPLDPLGHVKGLRSLGTAVSTGGDLYVGFPVGVPRVEFNAHRVIDPRLAVDTLDGFELESFAVVHDGRVHPSTTDEASRLRYAVGLYHFRKR